MTRPVRIPAETVAPRRCAIYTRKSTSIGLEQEFNSLAAQRETCLAYVERQPGWALVPDRYDDGGFTGANIDRPAFQRLLDDVDAGRIDVVVTYKVDRLSRSLSDFVKILDRFEKAGVSFVSVTQNFSSADAMGRLTLNMLMSFAAFEREMIAERTRDKIVASRRKGKWTGGPVPLGYHVAEGKLVVDDDEACAVRRIFELYQAHRSILRIVDELNGIGCTTKTRRRWTKDGILRLLKNPLYAGFTRLENERFAGEHSPIIASAVFDRVQALMKKPPPALNRRGEGDSILRGLARCGGCMAMMTIEIAHRGRRTYRYLRCDTVQKKGSLHCAARTRLPLGPVEALVIGVIREQTRRPAFVAEVTASLRGRLEARRDELAREAGALPKSIGEASSRVHNLGLALGEATNAGRRALARRLDEEGAIVEAQQARLAEVERELAALAGLEVEAAWITQTLERFDGMWEVLTDANRVLLVQAIVREIVLDPGKERVRITLVGRAGAEPRALARDAG